jgi:hypothetical protein
MSAIYDLSLCMFEYPAAQYDIHHWMSRFISKISSMNKISEHIYDIKVNGENIVCFSNVVFRDKTIRDALRSVIINNNYRLLLKTILVGNFKEAELLQYIELTKNTREHVRLTKESSCEFSSLETKAS